MKVCVIGLGTIGKPVAEYLGSFYNVSGFDIKKIKGEKYEYIDHIDKPDIYVICVPTHVVYDVCKDLEKDKLTIIESTLEVGTCRKISKNLGLKWIAHCPHRYWEANPVNYGVKQIRVLGALNKISFGLAMDFYEKAEIPTYLVHPIEVAEITKLVENSDRFVKIAFVEELKMLCDKIGVSIEDVRNAVNTKWNCDLLEARDGIGKECLPKDIKLLASIGKTPLLDGAMKTDKEYREWIKNENKR